MSSSKVISWGFPSLAAAVGGDTFIASAKVLAVRHSPRNIFDRDARELTAISILPTFVVRYFVLGMSHAALPYIMEMMPALITQRAAALRMRVLPMGCFAPMM